MSERNTPTPRICEKCGAQLFCTAAEIKRHEQSCRVVAYSVIPPAPMPDAKLPLTVDSTTIGKLKWVNGRWIVVSDYEKPKRLDVSMTLA